jgi:hypothetical protein
MKSKAWGPLFALLALLGAGLTGVSLQYSSPHNQTEPTKYEKGNGPIAETVIQAAPEKGDKKGKDEKSWTDPLLVLFNGLLTLFTCLLYRATEGLFKETAGLRSAADQQAQDMEASIAAANASAKAAQKVADVSEAALIVAERPYLIPLEPKLKMYRFGHPGSPPSEPPEPRWASYLDRPPDTRLRQGDRQIRRGKASAVDVRIQRVLRCGRAAVLWRKPQVSISPVRIFHRQDPEGYQGRRHSY